MKNPFAYQIEEKSYTSAQIALRQALIALLLNKKLEQISVKALCEQAAVARSTFYAYYENTSDLLAETENWFIGSLAKLDQKLTDAKNYQKPDDFNYFANLLAFVQKISSCSRRC
jgi:AcrR family transcriptional regulator